MRDELRDQQMHQGGSASLQYQQRDQAPEREQDEGYKLSQRRTADDPGEWHCQPGL